LGVLFDQSDFVVSFTDRQIQHRRVSDVVIPDHQVPQIGKHSIAGWSQMISDTLKPKFV